MSDPTMLSKPASHDPSAINGEEAFATLDSAGAFTLVSNAPDTELSPVNYFTDKAPAVTREDAPLASAIAHIDGFADTLQYEEQRSAVANVSKHFLMCFADFYHDFKNIAKATSDGAFVPANCKVKVPFQPMGCIKKSEAYLAFDRK